MLTSDVVILLRKRCAAAGSAKAWAKAANVSESYVSDVLRGRREPAPAILDALGLERVLTYRKAGQ